MPRRFERHARPRQAWDDWGPRPSRSAERASAAAEPDVRPPGRKDRWAYCKTLKGPHVFAFTPTGWGYRHHKTCEWAVGWGQGNENGVLGVHPRGDVHRVREGAAREYHQHGMPRLSSADSSGTGLPGCGDRKAQGAASELGGAAEADGYRAARLPAAEAVMTGPARERNEQIANAAWAGMSAIVYVIDPARWPHFAEFARQKTGEPWHETERAAMRRSARILLALATSAERTADDTPRN